MSLEVCVCVCLFCYFVYVFEEIELFENKVFDLVKSFEG